MTRHTKRMTSFCLHHPSAWCRLVNVTSSQNQTETRPDNVKYGKNDTARSFSSKVFGLYGTKLAADQHIALCILTAGLSYHDQTVINNVRFCLKHQNWAKTFYRKHQLVWCFSHISVLSLITAHQLNEKLEQGWSGSVGGRKIPKCTGFVYSRTATDKCWNN